MVTLMNMPWLDIGDLPSSYSKTKGEAYQADIVPKDKLPKTLYFKYTWWRIGFDKRSGMKKLPHTDVCKANDLQP